MMENLKIKFKKNLSLIFFDNKLFLFYFVFAILETIIVRGFTVKNIFSIKPLLVDMAIILIVGSIGFLKTGKKQYHYYMFLLILFTLIEFINHIYYIFYVSFASFSELTGLGQAETVTGSIFEKLQIVNFIYLLFPIIFWLIYRKISYTSYYKMIEKITKSKRKFVLSLLFGTVFISISLLSATKTDYSRLMKQWNRGAIVERFGILMYQGNDLLRTLTPKINSLFGYEEAAYTFKDFYTQENKYIGNNKYTNVLKDANIIFVHMESMQDFLMDLTFNGEEVTPTINKLSKEGMFFKNFYPQVSSGTSSDTEFTLLTGLMPASSGIVFTSYYDRHYSTIPKLLTDKGYFTFSMHGNYASMWNREKVHPSLGYQKMYFRESFETPDKDDKDYINLGISDSLFFEQALSKLEKIEEENKNYMGTIITLSNHSPFQFLDKYGDFDLSNKVTLDDGSTEMRDYLSNTAVGNYIKSSHYADVSLGKFVEMVKNSNYFNNTIFVFYGDHDAKLTRKEMNVLYNLNYENGELFKEGEKEYKEYNSFMHDLNKKTPLILWTKNKGLQNKIKGSINNVMGMYDVFPTLGNMLGIENKYVLGHDIFNIKNNNIVMFPNGNFVTNDLYYNNSSNKYYVTKSGVTIEEDYIEDCKKYVEDVLNVSNLIIVHDLIYNEGETLYNSEINGMREK